MARKTITIRIHPELVDRARNLVAFYPAIRFAHLIEMGLRTIVMKYERRHGRLFPPRRMTSLPVGRPTGRRRTGPLPD